MTNKTWQEEFDEDIAFKNLHLYDNITIAAELVSQRDEKIKSFISKVDRQAYEKGVKEALDIIEGRGFIKIEDIPDIVTIQLDTIGRIKEAISELLKKHEK